MKINEESLFTVDPRDAVHLVPSTPPDDQWVGRLTRGQGTREDAERAIRVFTQIGRPWAVDELRLALMPPLIQCPFCGGKAEGYPVAITYVSYAVRCADCRVVGPPSPSQEEAKRAWNRRAP